MQARLDSLKAARSASQPVNDMAANFSRSSRFDMRDSTTSVPAATASTGDFQGDWASNSEIRYFSISVEKAHKRTRGEFEMSHESKSSSKSFFAGSTEG